MLCDTVWSGLTGHRLHLDFALAISEEEQLVSVRNVNFRLDIGPSARISVRVVARGIAVRIVRHSIQVHFAATHRIFSLRRCLQLAANLTALMHLGRDRVDHLVTFVCIFHLFVSGCRTREGDFEIERTFPERSF
jgi:hypothetical protein